MSIDDLRNVSVKDFKSSAKEKIAELKGSLNEAVIEKIEEIKTRLLDDAV